MLIFKKLIIIVIAMIVIGLHGISYSSTSKSQQEYISKVLHDAQLEHEWASEISLWIKNSHGWSKSELLSVGHAICDSIPVRGYVITFWYSLAPRGQIARVKCF